LMVVEIVCLVIEDWALVQTQWRISSSLR
jgi:hypothetical protein